MDIIMETRTANLPHSSDHWCVRHGLSTLALLYATAALVLVLVQVCLYSPELRSTQLRQTEMLSNVVRDVAMIKVDSNHAASNALDTSYQLTLLADRMPALLHLNELELNATLALLEFFTKK